MPALLLNIKAEEKLLAQADFVVIAAGTVGIWTRMLTPRIYGQIGLAGS